MKPINLTVPWLPGWIDAVTLWPFIVYRRAERPAYPFVAMSITTGIRRPSGVSFPRYLVYLILLPFYWKRPREHSMEVEAYKVQRATYRQLDRTRRRSK